MLEEKDTYDFMHLLKQGIDAAATLGSGWREAMDSVGEVEFTMPAKYFISRPMIDPVEGHGGAISVVRLHSNDRLVLVNSARTHMYDTQSAVNSVWFESLVGRLDIPELVLTNAAGILGSHKIPGNISLITDHINLTGQSPLIGPSFVSMSTPYRTDYPLDWFDHVSVYAQVTGPQYETKAEAKMLRACGADIVGMSTAIETIKAVSLGIKVTGLSLLTNYAAGSDISHSEVTKVGEESVEKASKVLGRVLESVTSEK